MSTPLFLRSPVIPVPHGFSTRQGGVSQAPFDSLNLGFSVGDEPAAVTANLRRLATASEIPAEELHTISQVHGDVILEAAAAATRGAFPAVSGEGDALWSDRPGAAVGVKTADCVPVLIVDPDRRQVAAVHSGWKGTALQIARKAAESLISRGARPERLLCAVGPCIRACCYEVSDELASKFQAQFGADAIRPDETSHRPHLDLVHCVSASLRAVGVKAEHLDVMPYCDSCDGALFFSHRRDQGRTGRHLSFVQCRF